jgi:hypothetical protein
MTVLRLTVLSLSYFYLEVILSSYRYYNQVAVRDTFSSVGIVV